MRDAHLRSDAANARQRSDATIRRKRMTKK
jgi:hypothetical protein